MAQLRAPTTPSLLVPNGRTSIYSVRGVAENLLENPVARAILALVPGYALILDQKRHLVAAHGEVLEQLGLTTPESLQGLRTGELFRCMPVQDGFTRPRCAQKIERSK